MGHDRTIGIGFPFSKQLILKWFIHFDPHSSIAAITVSHYNPSQMTGIGTPLVFWQLVNRQTPHHIDN